MCVHAPAQTLYALLNKSSTIEWNPTGRVVADARTTTQRAFAAYSAQTKNSAQPCCGLRFWVISDKVRLTVAPTFFKKAFHTHMIWGHGPTGHSL